MTTTLPCRWDGESFTPLPAYARQADRAYCIGEIYPLAPVSARSQASHNHYFASLHEAWLNLSEEASERFPTEEHLRRYALIRTGHRDERSIVTRSKADARRVAAFVRPSDEFALVLVNEAMVTVLTAKSQSLRAMGKQAFEQSKADVLDFLEQITNPDAATPPQVGVGAGSPPQPLRLAAPQPFRSSQGGGRVMPASEAAA